MNNKIWLVSFFVILGINVCVQSIEGEKNKTIPDPETGEPMLIGYCTREAFSDTSFSWWFNPEYETYKPDSSALGILRNKINQIDITLIIGTWCSDSREEVPRFYKILDTLNYPAEKITLIAVDLDKKTEGNEIDGLEIEFSPTIIFYHDNSEIGRIVERPVESLEEDIIKIISE